VTTIGSALRGRDGITINGGVITLNSAGDAIRTTLISDTAVGTVEINAGTIDITTTGDGIQSVSDIEINGGNIRIDARDDGIFTGDSIIVRGGNIDIVKSMEGFEGRDITVTGGDIRIVASNDGLNARFPQDDDSRSRVPFIRISGGKVQTITQKDAIESDGYIYLEGGQLHVSGIPTGRPVGEMVITSGELINTGNALNIAEHSEQPYILADAIGKQTEGSLIEVKDNNNNIISSFTAPNAFANFIVFSSPEFKSGERYYFYINGERKHEANAI
jgi:hypothetical protein